MKKTILIIAATAMFLLPSCDNDYEAPVFRRATGEYFGELLEITLNGEPQELRADQTASLRGDGPGEMILNLPNGILSRNITEYRGITLQDALDALCTFETGYTGESVQIEIKGVVKDWKMSLDITDTGT